MKISVNTYFALNWLQRYGYSRFGMLPKIIINSSLLPMSFPQVRGAVAEVRLAETVELLGRGEVELLHDVMEGDIREGEPVQDMFRAFFQQPLIDRRSELLLEDASEGRYSVAAQVGKFLCVVGFHVVRQHEAFEGHLFPRHRVEEGLQLFRCIVAAEQPYQFLMFQVP